MSHKNHFNDQMELYTYNKTSHALKSAIPYFNQFHAGETAVEQFF